MAPTRCISAPARRRAAPPRGGARAFTLLELSVTLFIISVLAALAVPSLKRVLLESRSVALANDLRAFAAAFEDYAHENSNWPPGGGAAGEFPAGMAGRLSRTNWERITPIGGRYLWAPGSLHQGERYQAAIVIASVEGDPVTSDRLQLQDIDRRVDDDDLGTGKFRLGYRNYPVFVIEH
jgi:prepilin-type N-terminal cleavage/methylation domain-containing protein